MNQCEALYEPNKQDSTAAKGMAILAMAFLAVPKIFPTLP